VKAAKAAEQNSSSRKDGHMPTTIVLKAVTGERAGQEYAGTDRSQIIIGRSRSCTLHLPADPTVSRHHCMLDLGNGHIRVQDLGSRNGTFINGQMIGQRANPDAEDATIVDPAPQRLRSGDELRVGLNIFVVEIIEGVTPPSRPAYSAKELAPA
jgi:pSer/pThr/pTyr-binding forkhead associated (FHA) protein